jgi:serine/threonine-protein kinase
MHDEGIVHRNLNPDVIYLAEARGEGDSDVPLRLADFDYARMTQLRSIAGGLSAIGTEGYAAPEIWNGDEHDYRADVFSLGSVLFELLAGETLFSGISEVLDYRSVWREKRSRVGPARLRSLLDEMLVGDPDERLEDAGRVVDTLNAAAGEIAG